MLLILPEPVRFHYPSRRQRRATPVFTMRDTPPQHPAMASMQNAERLSNAVRATHERHDA
jgi:hypothetical protein